MTVASVTDTDVVGSDGKTYVHTADYAVNSIAFYHATKGGIVTAVDAAKGITTGKIGQLYRMKVTDSSSQTTWADWGLSGNNITLTIPQSFLNTAVYPITLAPTGDTFGYTTMGSSYTATTGANLMDAGGDAITGAAGTGVSISFGVHPTYSLNKLDMALYNGSNTLVSNGTTNEFTFTNWNSPQWATANFTSAPTLSASSYYIAINQNDNMAVHFDYTATNNAKYESYTYGTFPATCRPIAP